MATDNRDTNKFNAENVTLTIGGKTIEPMSPGVFVLDEGFEQIEQTDEQKAKIEERLKITITNRVARANPVNGDIAEAEATEKAKPVRCKMQFGTRK